MSKLLVSDDLCAIIAPLLPPELPKPKGGRHPLARILVTARSLGCRGWPPRTALLDTPGYLALGSRERDEMPAAFVPVLR